MEISPNCVFAFLLGVATALALFSVGAFLASPRPSSPVATAPARPVTAPSSAAAPATSGPNGFARVPQAQKNPRQWLDEELTFLLDDALQHDDYRRLYDNLENAYLACAILMHQQKGAAESKEGR